MGGSYIILIAGVHDQLGFSFVYHSCDGVVHVIHEEYSTGSSLSSPELSSSQLAGLLDERLRTFIC